MLCQNIMGLYSSPLRILVAMSLLYTQLGPASLVALGTLLVFMPLQARGCRPWHPARRACMRPCAGGALSGRRTGRVPWTHTLISPPPPRGTGLAGALTRDGSGTYAGSPPACDTAPKQAARPPGSARRGAGAPGCPATGLAPAAPCCRAARPGAGAGSGPRAPRAP